MSIEQTFIALAVVSLAVVFTLLSLLKAALRSLSRVSLRRLADASAPHHQRCLSRYLENPSESILQLQTLIQGSLVVIAVLLTHTVLSFDTHWPKATAALGLVLAVIVLEHVFPRIIQSSDEERLLIRLLPAFELLEPAVRLATAPIRLLLRAVVPVREEKDGPVSDEDVRAFIDVGEEEGIFGEEQGEILESLVDFGETIVREVMTPRVDMVSIEARRTIAETRDLIIETKHSRIPVYRDRVDHVEGIADIRVLLEAWLAGRDNDPISKWVRPTRFVPETKKVSSLLKDFQRDRVTLAVVVDEYGGISGLVTVEDLVEEIVGEITEEHEEGPVTVKREDDGSYLFPAKVDLGTIAETVGVELEEGSYDTLAGFVFATLGRVPTVGEHFEQDGLRFQVVDADRRRVNLVRVSPISPANEAEVATTVEPVEPVEPEASGT